MHLCCHSNTSHKSLMVLNLHIYSHTRTPVSNFVHELLHKLTGYQLFLFSIEGNS